MKIANKISFSFFITALLLIGVAVFAVYGVTRKTVESVMYAHLTSIAQSRCFHIETFLKMKKNTITQLSESVVIKHFLLKDKDDEDYDKGFNDVVQRLKDTREGVEYVHNILVLDKNGIIVVSDEESDIGSDLSADTFFSNAKEGVFIKDVYRSKRAKILSMAFSAPITNNETGEFLGVITEKITIEYLDRIITNRTGLGETGEIYLINKYGYMISSSRFIKDAFLKLEIDTEGTRKASKDIKRFGVEEHGNSPRLYINYNGVKVLGVHDHIHAMQWVLVAEISGKEALESLWKTKFLLTLIMIGVPIWAWLIGVFVAEFTFRPIEKLCKGSVIVGSGNLDYKVGTDSKDEIGQLSRAFDKMIEDLKNVVVPKNYLGDIIESMPEALVVLTPEGKMEKTNKELCDLLGYEDQELIGKDIGFLFSEEEKKIFLKESKFEKFLETGELRGAEANYKTKDGKKIPMIFSGSVMKDKGG
ncbi:MAG: PAS domain S-box protein, partial [Candidatus Omnitrophica bacterium]|nr:PAS domain S-box protein [Candidatus Omnitrophota bacterium]